MKAFETFSLPWLGLPWLGLLWLGTLGPAAGPVQAAMCALDDVPAATLLLPYFEVDWQDPQGVNTLFSINNASPEPTVAHVTFWTDWSQPTIAFDVFLTGYDVVTVDLRQAFAAGDLPITADEQNDPGDGISPHGLNPIWDGSFGGCQAIFPFPSPVVLGSNLARLRDGHTGQDVLGQGCMGEDHGDGIARGYVTVDAVNDCSLLLPHEPGYFGDGGTGVVSNRNVLWGKYSIAGPQADRGFGGLLVAIEAEDGFSGAGVAGYTFYGRYDPALSGADNREPLATAWAADYLLPDGGAGGTDLLVWRDSTTADTQEFYPCGAGPSWRPLPEAEVVAFDQEESAVELCASSGVIISPPAPEPNCFPLETQRVAVGSGLLAPPYLSGWLFLSLGFQDSGVDFDVDFGAEGNIAQSHVAVVQDLAGEVLVGYSALAWSSACVDATPRLTETGDIPPL